MKHENNSILHLFFQLVFFFLSLLLPHVAFLQTPENCSGGGDCMPMIISWEGAAEIQSGDVLIVEIDDTLLLPADMNPNQANNNNNNNIDNGWVIFRCWDSDVGFSMNQYWPNHTNIYMDESILAFPTETFVFFYFCFHWKDKYQNSKHSMHSPYVVACLIYLSRKHVVHSIGSVQVCMGERVCVSEYSVYVSIPYFSTVMLLRENYFSFAESHSLRLAYSLSFAEKLHLMEQFSANLHLFPPPLIQFIVLTEIQHIYFIWAHPLNA